MPAFMLLSIGPQFLLPDSPELLLDIDEDSFEAKVEAFVQDACAYLDGFYLEYQYSMISRGPAQEKLRRLADKYKVGVWGYANAVDVRGVPLPDGLEVCGVLQGLGVGFVNSDLPEGLL